MKELKAKFAIDKECKHSRRYACTDKEFPLQTVYINRKVASGVDKMSIVIILSNHESDIEGE